MTSKPIDINFTRQRISKDALASELRFISGDQQGQLEGHATIFGEVDSFNSTVARGAFKTSLKNYKADGRQPIMLFSHDVSRPIGVWEEVREDDVGLYVRGRLLRQTIDGDNTYKLLLEKAINGLSIGFNPVQSKFDKNGVRVFTDVDLAEISVVALPAVKGARIEQVRSFTRSASGHATAVADLLVTALKADTQSLIRKV